MMESVPGQFVLFEQILHILRTVKLILRGKFFDLVLVSVRKDKLFVQNSALKLLLLCLY